MLIGSKWGYLTLQEKRIDSVYICLKVNDSVKVVLLTEPSIFSAPCQKRIQSKVEAKLNQKCRLLITFANSLGTDQAGFKVKYSLHIALRLCK